MTMAGKGKVVDSPLGRVNLDSTGSAVGAVRVDPARAYQDIPELLKEVIDTGSQSAWAGILTRIDYLHAGIGHAMEALDAETGFAAAVKARVDAGQDLFFKPNIVSPSTIDRLTHGPGNIGVCTPWEFVAALMRWFHDRLDVSYHRMSLGEGGSAMSVSAGMATRLLGRAVTTQAIMEGRCGDDYGGWGFYFARRYLADTHDPAHTDDPMNGYEESQAGVCLPPGRGRDKLLVYDINKIAADRADGRDVPVAGGVNYTSLTLHKVFVGGDPADAADRADWPGCVLVNVPKLKIHQVELVTNAVKNLGIGLYPMEVNDSPEPGKIHWKYALPHRPAPTLKVTIPHTIWVGEADEETGLPVRDENGEYRVRRTGGIEGTMADVIEAVRDQDVMMVHVVDGIEATNVSHAGPGYEPTPEGFVFASLDPVAADVVSSRYLFSMIPVVEARRLRDEHGLPSQFIQRVPLPRVEGRNIVTGEGLDSPLSRYLAFRYCEQRGLGRRHCYVVGRDEWHGGQLASLEGRLGRVADGVFSELLTGTMYYAMLKPLWDLQTMAFGYLEANDALTGSDYKATLLRTYDEDGDGVIDYSEKGKGFTGSLAPHGMRLMMLDLEPGEMLRIRFHVAATMLRGMKKGWNPDGHDYAGRGEIAGALMLAWRLSQSPVESPDPFFPEMTWGNGKWPSLQYAMHRQLCARIYGPGFPDQLDSRMSPYGIAFRHADARWNGGKYAAVEPLMLPPDGASAVGDYHAAVAAGTEPLPFVLYVPRGYASAGNGRLPNVEETDDPALTFTASFDGGKEVWRKLLLAEIP